MKFFLDTEFMEDGRTIDLLSIGVVAEDGREFYRQNATADQRKANGFVRNNVFPKLYVCPKGLMPQVHRGAPCGHPECTWRPHYLIGRELFEFVRYEVDTQQPYDHLGRFKTEPEFWGYYADYDWVAVAQLFGQMVDLPAGWPMYCRDLKQWADDLQVELPAQSSNGHNALADARWNKNIYYYLSEEVKYRAGRKEAGSVDQEPSDLRGDTPRSPRARKVRSSGDKQLSVS